MLCHIGRRTGRVRATALEVMSPDAGSCPSQRFLDPEEAEAVLSAYRRKHPSMLRMLSRWLGWDYAGGGMEARRIGRDHPLVAFAPRRT